MTATEGNTMIANHESRPESELFSFHDYLLVKYSVDCEQRKIVIQLETPNWATVAETSSVEFGGVQGYELRNDAFGNIVFALERISPALFISRFGKQIRESYRESGSPGPWAAEMENAVAFIESNELVAFSLSSSYGLCGWILCKEATINREL